MQQGPDPEEGQIYISVVVVAVAVVVFVPVVVVVPVVPEGNTRVAKHTHTSKCATEQ